MFIHFAFGSLAKQGKVFEQTENFINLILKEKRLLVSKCQEFIPAFPVKGAKRIPNEMFKVTGNGVASATFHPQQDPNWLKNLPDDTRISYLPVNVSMICFIQIPFTQLASSNHATEYGQLGIVLTNHFLRQKSIKQVYYYTETSIWQDESVIKWNYGRGKLPLSEKRKLEEEIVNYRKPAYLFPDLKETMMKLSTVENNTNLECVPKYVRYPVDYDFTKESEFRITFSNEEQYLQFDEKDIFMIIVPDASARSQISSFLKTNYSSYPKVELYP